MRWNIIKHYQRKLSVKSIKIKFTATQIAELVQTDISRDAKLDEVVLESAISGLLEEPISKRFTNPHEVGFKWFWIVWDGSYKDGTVIVYDPRIEQFGLASKSENKKYGSFIGFYGSFVETFTSI